MVRSITCALAVESHPSRSASPTGASTGRSRASASRTVAGPQPLWPPATAVTKSRVEAHPNAWGAWVASRSRTTSSSTASMRDFSASRAATTSIFSPSPRAAHNTSSSSQTARDASATNAGAPDTAGPIGGTVVLVMALLKHPGLTVLNSQKPLSTRGNHGVFFRTDRRPLRPAGAAGPGVSESRDGGSSSSAHLPVWPDFDTHWLSSCP